MHPVPGEYVGLNREVNMSTNVVINDELIQEAFKYSLNISTKKDLIESALTEYVNNRKRKTFRNLRGKINFQEAYDYKSMRQ
jgi:Arc/MetJ family transcription regulator